MIWSPVRTCQAHSVVPKVLAETLKVIVQPKCRLVSSFVSCLHLPVATVGVQSWKIVASLESWYISLSSLLQLNSVRSRCSRYGKACRVILIHQSFETNTIDTVHHVCTGPMTSTASKSSMSTGLTSSSFNSARHLLQSIKRPLLGINLVLFFATIISPRISFHMESRSDSILIALCRYHWKIFWGTFSFSIYQVSDLYHRFNITDHSLFAFGDLVFGD